MAASELTSNSKNEMGMPLLGFGTYQASDEDAAAAATLAALKAGYRHIDTAQAYGNEQAVGKALQDSGIAREDVFVTTKLWPGNAAWKSPSVDFQGTIDACKASLAKLGLDCVDLYLIHHPFDGMRLHQWKAMLEIKKMGLAKHVGVSNYGVKHLQEIQDAGLALPEANQLEIHPLCCQKEVLAFMAERNILPIAYSSLAPLPSWRADEGQGGDVSSHLKKGAQERLNHIAEMYKIPTAKLLLRWALQRGFPILPKSTKAERILENANLFDVEITAEHMDEMNSMDIDAPVAWALGAGLGFNPTKHITDFVPLESSGPP